MKVSNTEDTGNDARAQSKSNNASPSKGQNSLSAGSVNPNDKASNQKRDALEDSEQADVASKAEVDNKSTQGGDEQDVEYVLEALDEGEGVNVTAVQADDDKEHMTIETGDSIKVKQVLDDSIIQYVTEVLNYEPDYTSDNWKLGIMFTACCFALAAQFCPIPFPESRLIVGSCCAAYFFLSGVAQSIVTIVDGDRVLATRAGKSYVGSGRIETREHPLTFCTKFDRFQEWFSLIIHRTGDKGEGGEENPHRTIGEMYVGKYFTAAGEFDEERWRGDVLTHIKLFEAGKYGVFKYDHKSD